MKIIDVLKDVLAEYKHSIEKHGDYHSLHEGFSVLLEEVDELWDEVRKKSSTNDQLRVRYTEARKEAIQVASSALKVITFIDGRLENDETK